MAKFLIALARILLGIAAIFLVALATHWLRHRPASEQPPSLLVATLSPQHRLLPPFELQDGNGQKFTRQSLQGHYSFVFFGYTQCPDICPTTLIELHQVTRALSDLPINSQPAVVFVSVDPERDRPDILKNYIHHFNPAFIGLTGGNYALKTLTQAVGARYEYSLPAMGNYWVTHSAAIFLVAPNMTVRATFAAPHVAKGIERDYRRIVATDHQ